MYIGSTGPAGLHHLVYEVVDNAVDEAMAGHCTRIDISLLPDGGCEVIDNGRGIPVGKHPKFDDLTAAEVVLTVLHAGGKFGGGGYKVSGGLHGVGVSVVNALSTRVEVDIDREGKRHSMSFINGGQPHERLTVTGDSPTEQTGTTVRFWPDGTIFEELTFRAQTLLDRLQMMAFLNRGLEIRFRDLRNAAQRKPKTSADIDAEGYVAPVVDEAAVAAAAAEPTASDDLNPDDVEYIVFKYDGGISDFVEHVNATKEALFDTVGYFESIEDEQEVEIAFQWNTGFNSDGLHSFANGISTGEGGMHEEGFRKSLTNVVNKYAFEKNI